MDFGIVFQHIGLYIKGLGVTLQLVVGALVLGLGLALPLAVLRTARHPLLWAPAWGYIYFFRGTPLLVQMYLLYYGAGQFQVGGWVWTFLKDAHICALIAFSFNTAAYTAEILRGALQTIPTGEIEAARACGMSSWTVLRRILLPSACRRALPAYGNEVVFMLHGSAIAGCITITDLTGAARLVNARYYVPYEAFLTAAAFYMAVTFLVVWGIKRLEKRWLAHLQRDEDR
jgi:arginine/ornithine transport system permease protein